MQLGGCVTGPVPKRLESGNYFAEQRKFNLRLAGKRNVNFDQYLKVRGQTVEQFRTGCTRRRSGSRGAVWAFCWWPSGRAYSPPMPR